MERNCTKYKVQFDDIYHTVDIKVITVLTPMNWCDVSMVCIMKNKEKHNHFLISQKIFDLKAKNEYKIQELLL